MQEYIYTAKDKSGQYVKAKVEAASPEDAAKLLLSKDLFPIDVKADKKSLSLSWVEKYLHRVSFKDKVIFTRQLATMVKAGLPITKAIHLLGEQTEKEKLKEIIKNIYNSMEGGTTLSRSLAQFPDQFSAIYVSMVEAGEISGQLDEVLLQLADQEEKTAEINSKIRGALTYPTVVLAVIIGVSVMMLTLVLPQVGNMYKDLNKPLPGLTQALLSVSAFITNFWYLTVLALIGAVYALRLYIKSTGGRSQLDRLKMEVPIFKPLVMKMYMSRFTRTLGSLVASGVPILQALGMVAKSVNNVHLEASINEIETKIKAGGSLSENVAESPLFLPLVAQMLSVGEQTGTLGDSLSRVATYYENEVDDAVKNISSLIEPATMIVLGVIVAFLIGAVLYPIYGLVSSVGA